MKSIIKSSLIALFIAINLQSFAQISSATIQVAGLTCSMCSFSTEKAIRTLPFIQDVKTDLNKAEYEITFKENQEINLDLIADKVEGAGFSISKLLAVVDFDNIEVKEDSHISIGKYNFHIMNSSSKILNGKTQILYLDKKFMSQKEFKKLASKSTFPCFESGKKEDCCQNLTGSNSRIFHIKVV